MSHHLALTSFLEQVSFFRGIPPSGLARLALLAREKTFPAGTDLMRQGEVAQVLYVVLSGRVRVARSHPELLQPVPLAELGPGEVVGEMGVLDDEPRAATVTAIEETHALEVSAQALALTLLQFPEVARGLLTIISRRLRNTDALIEQASHSSWS